MNKKQENTEGWIFDLDYSNYKFSLNKNSLKKIKEWEEIKTTIYHNSYLFKTKEDLKDWMKKELIIWLLWNDSDNQSEILIEEDWQESKEIIIKISESLLENLINTEWDSYEYCYNTRGNKIDFYINESSKKNELNNEIEKIKRKYKQK